MKKVIFASALVVVAAGLALGWVTMTPERAIARTLVAIEAGNVEAIEEIVDFDRVRADGKVVFTDFARQDKAFAAFLDANPAKSAEFDRYAEQFLLRLDANALASLFASAPHESDNQPESMSDVEWQIDERDWDSFVAVAKDADVEFRVKYGRDGLSWRIVGFEVSGMDLEDIKTELAKQFESEAEDEIQRR